MTSGARLISTINHNGLSWLWFFYENAGSMFAVVVAKRV